MSAEGGPPGGGEGGGFGVGVGVGLGVGVDPPPPPPEPPPLLVSTMANATHGKRRVNLNRIRWSRVAEASTQMHTPKLMLATDNTELDDAMRPGRGYFGANHRHFAGERHYPAA